MSASTFKCPQCNAPIFYPGGDDATIECMFCGHAVSVPPERRTPPSPAAAQSPATPSFSSLMNQIGVIGDIAELARKGDKLEAIKRYRETFKVGLAEAKDAVDKMAAGQFIEASESILTTSQFTGFNALPTEGAEPDLVYHVKQLLAAGNKIEAIKLYRQTTGVGLKEAKEAVEAIGSGEAVHLNVPPLGAGQESEAAQNPALVAAIRTLLGSGNKIEAIKVYRQATQAGLKEAKEAVDAIEAGAMEADTFEVGTANASPYQRTARPPVSATPASQNSGLNCLAVGVIIGAVLLGMMGVAVALLVFNLAG